MSFRNFLPSNDITKPEIFAELTRRGAALTPEKKQELNQLHGTIKEMPFGGFRVALDLLGDFVLRDDYGAEAYIAKYSKRDEVFDLIDSIEFQFCDTLRDFDVLIRSAFGRRPTRLA